MTKTCSSKFNAQRAAKRLGLDIAMLDFARTADGSWGWSDKTQLALIDPPGADDVPAVEANEGAQTPAGRDRIEGSGENVATTATAGALTTPLGRAPKGKTRMVLEAAIRDDGVTTSELAAMTGWTKFGGFYNAIDAAGLKLHRCREGKDTRWFAVPADETCLRAYVEAGGHWTLFGLFDTAAEALAAANEAAEVEGETCTCTLGKRGEVHLRASFISTGIAQAA